jgi:arylsulfatase A-like enzyme
LGIRTRHDFGPSEGHFKASIQRQLVQRAHGWLGTLRKKQSPVPCVRQLFFRIDDLSLRQDTLIVFTSDHGFNFGHHGLVGKGNASTPRNMYDTSLLVPLIFSHPVRLRAKRQIDALVSVYDFLPTLLDYVGLPPPRQRNLPGQSYAPLLAGKRVSWKREVYGEYGKVWMVRTEDWKYVHRYPDGPHELFDLKKDPAERVNLAGDPGVQGRALELLKRLKAWFARYAEPAADPVGPVVAGK